ncbi:MAG: tRNA (guanosine(46)-N7)-methyltransferase TrmB [Pseudomonadota bacterium]
MATDEHDIGGETARPWRNFYGRRHGKRMSDHQQDLLETRLEALAPAGVGWAENQGRAPLDPAALVPGAEDLWLEIGFGGGEHMIATAEAHPEIGLIGCEPYVNGVAKLLSAIERAHGGQGLANLRLHAGDARDLMDVLPAGAIGRVYLLYPDPWPKKRHHKRRFVNPDNLDQLARVMRPGAEIRIATDIEDYVRHTLEAMRADGRFAWTAERPADWRAPWPGWPSTRYEAKALREGRRPHYLVFTRR